MVDVQQALGALCLATGDRRVCGVELAVKALRRARGVDPEALGKKGAGRPVAKKVPAALRVAEELASTQLEQIAVEAVGGAGAKIGLGTAAAAAAGSIAGKKVAQGLAGRRVTSLLHKDIAKHLRGAGGFHFPTRDRMRRRGVVSYRQTDPNPGD